MKQNHSMIILNDLYQGGPHHDEENPNLRPDKNKDPQTSAYEQCSRLMPSNDFHFEGLSNFSPSVERLVQIQDVNPRI